jgi:serine phosphatase RsbU (regulator of sigma subunit)
MPATVATPVYSLEPLLGPPIGPIPLTPGGPIVAGRNPECGIRLPETESTVSRRHFSMEFADGTWRVTDLGSRHGTFHNNRPLAPNAPSPVAVGDVLRFGPWTMRLASSASQGLATLEDDPGLGGAQLVRVADLTQRAIDRKRLEFLISCAKTVQASRDEHQLAACVLDALLEGTGFPRVAVVRGKPGFDRVEVLATKALGNGRPSTAFSRSLLAAAASGQVVQLKRDDALAAAASILSAGTSTAMAVPVMLDGTAVMVLYLDARHNETPPHADAGAFCQALSEMCAMALAAMQRARLEAERLRLHEQMGAAKTIQEQLLPAPQGRAGSVAYALKLVPGRFVAGDLFDVFPLSQGRTAILIGDVAGKGLPAAILMATTQSYLNAVLRHGCDPATAAAAVNTHLCTHAPEGKFVSAWMGVYDPHAGTLDYVDAGHGYCVLRTPGSPPERLRPEGESGDPPLRVLDSWGFSAQRVTVTPGTRLVLFSDGVVEQASLMGELFGFTRTIETLAGARSVADDVETLAAAVYAHAAGAEQGDDLTVASVEFLPPA